MLWATNISKKFNNLHVMRNVSFSVDRDDFVVIMGPNGTGKSTLFDIISGKTIPDEGIIHLNGDNISSLPERERAFFIGRLFQNTYQGSCSHLTVRENIAMASLKKKKASLRSSLKAFNKEIIEELLVPLNLNLEKLLDMPMGLLSGGQRQIISFVMVILNKPKILLLDEPTAALDPISATKLLVFAKSYARMHRVPTLLITHDPMIAKHIGNRLWILEGGEIRNELGLEKNNLDPSDFFHQVEYKML